MDTTTNEIANDEELAEIQQYLGAARSWLGRLLSLNSSEDEACHQPIRAAAEEIGRWVDAVRQLRR